MLYIKQLEILSDIVYPMKTLLNVGTKFECRFCDVIFVKTLSSR
jgi:hypothetical protein